MQVSTGRATLGVARARARKWLRVFQMLVRVLDRLEPQESPLARALVFLIQRALGRLEGNPAAMPVAPLEGLASEEGAQGDELVAAVRLSRPLPDRRAHREDPASDELEVLLVLAGALTESEEGGAYGDPAVPVDALFREYRSLQKLSAADVLRVELFPLAFRRRWSALLESAAAKDDPLRRLSFELAVMKVIHALYALAIGWRRAEAFDRADRDGDAWFALSLGEALLKSSR